MKKLLLAALFLLPGALYAQAPDCQFAVTFVGAGRQGTTAAPQAPTAFPAFSTATGTPCISWHVTYQAINMTNVSLSFQGVNDANGTPGATFVTIGPACPPSNPCTVTYGSNPLTDTTQSYLGATSYFPWVSLLMNTFTGTGTVQVKIVGFR